MSTTNITKAFQTTQFYYLVLFLSRPIAIPASKITFCLGCPSNLVSSSSSPRAPGSVRFLPSCTVFPLGSQYYLERVPEKSYFHLKSPLLVIKYYVIRITSYVIRVVLVVVPFWDGFKIPLPWGERSESVVWVWGLDLGLNFKAKLICNMDDVYPFILGGFVRMCES